MSLLPAASRAGTAALVASAAATGLLPIAVMLATGVLVAAVGGEAPPVAAGAGAWAALWVLAALLGLLHVAVPFLDVAVERLAHDLDLLLRDRTLRAVLAPPTLAHLEDPALADELAMARTVGTETVQTPRALAALADLGAARVLATGSAALLLSYRWWAPVVLVAVWTVANETYRRGMARLVASLEGTAEGFRRARYLGDLALGGAAAKELRLFGLARWLADRFAGHWREGMRQSWTLRGGQRWALLGASLVVVACHALVCGALVRSAVRGDLGLGGLAVYLQAVVGMGGFGWDADNQYVLRLGVAPLPHALRVCETAGEERFQLPGSAPVPSEPLDGIRFEAVCFAYPGTDRQVLRDLDLWLPAGRSLAIVGDNGSGKTTLLKLLCRFYDPVGGRITVDGTDLRDLEAARWQRRVAAAFQDFGRHPLSARDSITLGDPRRWHDQEGIERAAAASGAAEFIGRLPDGWDTPLSRELPGGTDPSGGQWQRLALARVLFAVEGGAAVLVLDEPTANLDIRAEADFYERFLGLTRGLTTVLVSHRFSTVRHADHIVVLAGGRVTEAGTHAELVALGGRYATMFELQATAFRAETGA